MSRCDWPGCRGIPVAELYDLDAHNWKYLCARHYAPIRELLENGQLPRMGAAELTRRESLAALADFLWMPLVHAWWTLSYRLRRRSDGDLDDEFPKWLREEE